MGIRSLTPLSQVDDFFRRKVALLEKITIRNLAYIGENALAIARDRGSYTDRTGNLRSSTGYIVLLNGTIVGESSFTPVKNGVLGKDGGRDYARSLVSQYPTGAVLIVVAGMDYAAYVSAKGYDVLDSSELIAKRLVRQLSGKADKR